MKNKKGFTLTEVLLAVMIVGLIGVALASLTRAAARESGVGRSKIMLRNNLSSFMRTLREDIAQASYILYLRDTTAPGTESEPLVYIAENVSRSGEILTTADGRSLVPRWIMYCFVPGNIAALAPSGATRGGVIRRHEMTSKVTNASALSACKSSGQIVLTNVKYIADSGYPVPMFKLHDFSHTGTKSLMDVKIITELNSTPVVNDVIEETFAVPNGY